MIVLVTKKKKARQTYFAPALEKGLDVLEVLAVAQTPQSLTDLARTLKRTSSELFRMIDVLEKRGYIAREPVSSHYHLTLKLYELAHTHSPVENLLKASVLPMQRLAETIHESCHLCVLNGPWLVVIAQAENPDPVRLSVEVGYRALPLTTVSGRILVAFLEQEERERFLKEDKTYLKMSSSERTALQAELTKIRKDGCHLAPSSRRTGFDASCLVGNPRIGVTAALGVPFIPGSANDGKERQLIPVIQKTAKQITESLALSSPLK